MDVTSLEGYYYFINNLKEVGVIESNDSDLLAIHTELPWDEYEKELDKVSLRSVVSHFKLLKTTRMKDGRYNHVFVVIM